MRENLKTSHFNRVGFGMELFTGLEIEAIHKGTLRIMEKTGIVVESDEALKIFQAGGANVDYENKIVKFPAYMVEEAIKCAPGSVLLAGRDPRNDFYLGGGTVRFTSFGEAVMVFDPNTGERRKVSKEDVGNTGKLVDALDHHDMCWDSLVPSDVPAQTYAMHAFEAYLNNTTKNICVATTNRAAAQIAIEMAAAVAGDKKKLKERPIFIGGTCPQSPLYYHQGLCEVIIEQSKAGIPNMITSAVTAGGTGPVTLAGTLVIHNAELLTGLVLSQLVAKGSPYIYGCCTSILDLRKASSTYGCPELGMLGAALAKLTKYYQIPNVVAGFWTDSKLSDMQAGHEKTLNAILPALSGADMIFGTGGLEGGLTHSFGQLVADNEMAGMIKHVLKGIPVNDETLALEVIERVGPRGNFLGEEHTLKHMRECQSQPILLERDNRDNWENSGAKDMAVRANEEAIRILEKHKPKPLSNGVAEQLSDIIARAEKEFGIKGA